MKNLLEKLSLNKDPPCFDIKISFNRVVNRWVELIP